MFDQSFFAFLIQIHNPSSQYLQSLERYAFQTCIDGYIFARFSTLIHLFNPTINILLKVPKQSYWTMLVDWHLHSAISETLRRLMLPLSVLHPSIEKTSTDDHPPGICALVRQLEAMRDLESVV